MFVIKYYVGQTRELIKRQKNHVDWKLGVTKNSRFPQTDINSILISYIPCDSLDEITELEKKWIRETGSYIDGY
ncbi:MAG: GIY-YIG nuclease family protein, partial [Mycoplasmataceae bacterium]|nr:GIY-YIG nuclease family protein [Mycoplasmataceae bacterium]